MSGSEAQKERADIDASAWLARLSGEGVVEQDGHAFDAWLAADPANRPAYERALAHWHEFDRRAEAVLAELDSVAQGRARAVARNRHARWGGWLAAGGAALAATFALTILPPALREPPAQVYQTARAQHQKVRLADGSTIDMDAETRLTVRLGHDRRQVTLAAGQAIFDVAHDPSHPFTVAAGGRVIRDVGTQFEVRDRADGLTVTVAQGKVEVRPGAAGGGGQTYLLTPGQRLDIGLTGVEAVRQVDPQETFSWRSGRLVYRNQPLQDVVADLNREFSQQIAIGDPALARIPITGVIVLDDPHAVATRLSLMLPVKAVPSAQGLTLLKK